MISDILACQVSHVKATAVSAELSKQTTESRKVWNNSSGAFVKAPKKCRFVGHAAASNISLALLTSSCPSDAMICSMQFCVAMEPQRQDNDSSFA
jgi:hypothetical protein